MMNGAREDEYLLSYTHMSVLERQRVHLNYHHPGLDSTLAGFFSDSSTVNAGEFNGFLGTSGLDLPYRDTTMESDARLSVSPENIKKRKFDSFLTETKVLDENKTMMTTREDEEKSKITKQNNESTMKVKSKSKKEEKLSSNDSSKVTKELPKTDYIHVRARRGQATDSHSLAERVRREKISERMKYLQDLVPGCSKITGKAGMLDEIINYVQSLQRQVEFLSMKLAVVNPRLDFDMDDIFAKEVVSTPMTSVPNIVMPSNEIVNAGYLHFNPMQHVVTNSDPMSCFNNGLAPSVWDSDVQNIYSNIGV